MPVKPEHQVAVDKYTSTDHKGQQLSPAHKQAMLHANPMIAKVLAARAATLTDEDRQAVKQILTPETAPALKKLLPELSKLFDAGLKTSNG